MDYEIRGSHRLFAVELDGYGPHSGRTSFSYDRMRQNDLHSAGRIVMRFSYDSIRNDTARCIEQLQALLLSDPLLSRFVVAHPQIEVPEMDPDPLRALDSSPMKGEKPVPRLTYFDSVRHRLNRRTLRECQTQALEALINYYGAEGNTAACVMSVAARDGSRTLPWF